MGKVKKKNYKIKKNVKKENETKMTKKKGLQNYGNSVEVKKAERILWQVMKNIKSQKMVTRNRK